GGDEELFQAGEPIFSSIASQYFYLGGGGSGSAMKLVANTLLGVGMQAIAESVAFGQKEGLDRHRLLEVLSHTAVIAPAHLGKLSRADLEDYSPQFALPLMNKDFHERDRKSTRLNSSHVAISYAVFCLKKKKKKKKNTKTRHRE